MARKILLRTALGLLVVFAALQLKQPDRANPPVETDVGAPAEVNEILRRACYDCHSHETRWPWYGYVAPLSWCLDDDIREARGELNFSRWPAHDFEEQRYIFKDIRKQILENKMPLKSYRIMHAGARLSQADKEILLNWARP